MPLVSLDEGKALAAQGKVIIFPTETVFGIGCTPKNADSVEQLLDLKDRTLTAGTPVLVAGSASAEAIVQDPTPDAARLRLRLQQRYWPGPLTLVVAIKNESGLASGVCAADGSLAIRHSSSAVANALCQAAGGLLIATSANRKAQPPALTAEQALAVFPEVPIVSSDEIGDSELTSDSRPSTILDVRQYPPIMIREGAIALDSSEF